MAAGEWTCTPNHQDTQLIDMFRDRTNPVGYKLSVIPFANGEPVAAPDNTTSTSDVLANADNAKCPDNCFRPVGIAFDGQGRLFMSSDATGEIYVVVRSQDFQGTAGTSSSGASSPTGSAVSGTARLENNASLVILSIHFLTVVILFGTW